MYKFWNLPLKSLPSRLTKLYTHTPESQIQPPVGAGKCQNKRVSALHCTDNDIYKCNGCSLLRITEFWHVQHLKLCEQLTFENTIFLSYKNENKQLLTHVGGLKGRFQDRNFWNCWQYHVDENNYVTYKQSYQIQNNEAIWYHTLLMIKIDL